MSEHKGFKDRLKAFLAAPVFEDDEEKTRVARLLNSLLGGMFVAIVFGVCMALLFFTAKVASCIAFGLLFLVALACKLLLQKGRVREGNLLLVATFWLIVTGAGVVSTNGNPFVAVSASLVAIAGLLLGVGAALIVSVLSSVAYLGVAVFRALGGSLPQVFFISDISTWAVLTMSLLLIVGPLDQTLRELRGSLTRVRQSNLELETRREQLEALVAQRTDELGRRTSYLGATTAIAAAMAAVRQDTPSLLMRVTDVISEQFGFYHTGIFLVDSTETWAVLQAASSEGGKRMMARGHRLSIGTEGIVGAAVARGEVRIAQDVGQDAAFFNNPDLPETRSEIALPLRVRNKVLGALDVQSKTPQAFTREDVSILQAIADQVAVAINNADLLRQLEESVTAERHLYAARAREAWQELVRQRAEPAYVSDVTGVRPAAVWEPRMAAALQTGQIVTDETDPSAIALPLKVRDQVIGVLDGRKPGGAMWTSAEMALLQTLAEQLSVALESGRLYRDTQLRAARERLVGEVSGHIRETLELERMLRTAAEEMRQALDLEDMIVRLVPGATADAKTPDA